MTEKPILFSGAMVRAILSGNKTMTRRVVKPPRDENIGSVYELFDNREDVPEKYACFGAIGTNESCSNYGVEFACPYGAPGDRLWVRETFAPSFASDDDSLNGFCYAATNDGPEPLKWKPSIFMPRWASRITLEITGVRVERLQAITDADARAEGASNQIPCGCKTGTRNKLSGGTYEGTYLEGFCLLWDSINGDRKDKHGNRLPYGWRDNPWVWVIEFRMINQKEAK